MSELTKDDDVLTHDDLVEEITLAHRELSGKELAEIWNDIFPSRPVKYMGDSFYEWIEG